MPRISPPRAPRVQVYLNDPRIMRALSREARAARMPLSQAAGRAIARGLQNSPQADPEDRLLALERSLRDHIRLASRDMQIIQELLLEMARSLFMRLPDPGSDVEPSVQAQVEQRIGRLLDAAAARIAGIRARSGDGPGLDPPALSDRFGL